MKKIILTGLLIAATVSVLLGQGWQRRYGQASVSERGEYITRTDDGGYLVRAAAGEGSMLSRLDAEGDSLWSYRTGSLAGASGPTEDAVWVHADGRVFSIFGDSLMQFDAAGQRTNVFYTAPYRLLGLQPDGLLLWKGAATGDSLFLRKLDFTGNLLWEQQHAILGEIQEVRLAPDNRILALFTTWGLDNKSKLAQFDSMGALQTVLVLAPAFYYKMAIDAAGNYLFYETFLTNPQAPNNAVYLLKTTPDGQVLWSKTYLVAVTEVVQRIIPASDGGWLLVGSSWYDAFPTPRLYKLDALGNEVWKRLFQVDHPLAFRDVCAANDGTFTTTGYQAENPDASAPTDAIVWKFSAQGYLFTNLLRGRVVRDTVPDCEAGPDEPGMAGWIAQAGIVPAVTDDAGRYELSADTGVTAVRLYPPGTLWQVCPGFDSITLFVPYQTDTLDIPVYPLISCPQMEVSIGFPRLRRCFENTATIQWRNVGTASEANGRVLVLLPPELDYIGSTLPASQIQGDSLWFDLGYADVGASGSFQLTALVNCDSTELGQILCVEARIFPDYFCLTDPGWTGASLQVEARCQGDTLVKFTVRNKGTAPTSPGLEYIIIEDQVVLMQGPLNLSPGVTYTYDLTALDGELYRIEADQEPLHPGASMPAAWVEGCGPASGAEGLALQYPADDADLFVDIDCHRVVGSYDPNDKSASPMGYGPEHFIRPNTDISYRIRFQNTGTDTAFTVVIRDTLSAALDPSTVRVEAASHPYTWQFVEGNILKFVFDNILLPDSATNEPGSNGHISFRISQKKDLPPGTVIPNRAAIYFDFNLPIITNEVFHTLGENFLAVSAGAPEEPAPGFLVFPNPAPEVATLFFDQPAHGVLWLYTVQGRLIRQESVRGGQHLLSTRDLPSGTYLLVVRDKRQTQRHGKIIVP